MNRQEELPTGVGTEGGAEGSSATGDGGQAGILLKPDTDDTGSGSLLDSILSTFLKKRSSDVWVHPGLEMKVLYPFPLNSTA